MGQEAEVKAARFLGPRTGKTIAIAFTTSSSSTDLGATNSAFAHINGNFVGIVSTADCQIAFGDTVVTITANDPYVAAGALNSFIAEGQILGTKGLAASGTLYIWPAS